MPTPLSDFAPLIQLLAGICAICFYDNLVKNIIATKKRKELNKQLADIKEALHGLLSDKKHAMMTFKIDEDLTNFSNQLTHIGRLTCCIAVMLLVMAGFEKSCHYCYEWLIIVATLYVLYIILIVSYHKIIKYTKHSLTFIVPTAFVAMILALTHYNDIKLDISKTSDYILAFTSVTVLFGGICGFGIKYHNDRVFSFVYQN